MAIPLSISLSAADAWGAGAQWGDISSGVAIDTLLTYGTAGVGSPYIEAAGNCWNLSDAALANPL